MKVMTFNIQHGLDYKNQVIDLPLFADFIRKQEVDVCGLNEVRGSGNWDGYTDQTETFKEHLGCNGYFGEAIKVVGTNPYGNAFLTKLNVKSTKTVHIPDSDDRSEDVHYEHRCAVVATIEKDGREFMLMVCHMGLAKSEARLAVETVCRLLDESDMPCILMGDFNHTKDSGILDPLFERLEDTDLYCEKEGVFTFPSYAPGVKIDYILFRGMECKKAQVVETVVSDHFPIIAELMIK